MLLTPSPYQMVHLHSRVVPYAALCMGLLALITYRAGDWQCALM